jgi:hypothetical protein
MNFNIMDIFSYLGLDLNDPNVPPFVLLFVGFLILCLLALITFINIIFYFLVLFFIEHEYIKKKIENRKFLIMFVNIYKKTRFVFVMYEILIFLFLMGYMIFTCLKVINHHYSIF